MKFWLIAVQILGLGLCAQGAPGLPCSVEFSGFPTELNHSRSFELRLNHSSGPVAGVDLYLVQDTLRFDIEVYRPFRGKGIYSEAFRRALTLSPGVRYLPAQLPIAESENARAFIRQSFGQLPNFQMLALEFFNEWGTREVSERRLEWIQSFMQIPAAKVRARQGFGKLTKLVLDPIHGCIDFLMERGDLDLNEVEVQVIQPKSRKQLSTWVLWASGSVTEEPIEKASVGKNYARPRGDFRYPCLEI